MIYFISDTHFGHKGSLRWNNGTIRPRFSNIKEADNLMIENWNKIVKPEDIVYFLGDFAYKCSKNYAESIFWQLNGKKHLIIGNHDYKIANTFKNCWESTSDILTININNKDIILCHYPIYSWKNMNKGSIHLHGHTHEKNTNIKGKIFNVSVENIDYTPISLDNILEKLNI